jgi:uncharacterized integral membrane protein
MRKFFTALVMIPLGLLFVVFAVANRHFVTISFDPFNTRDPSISVTMPLFAIIIVVAILGVVAGGTATWFRQRHWRRTARLHEAGARQAQAQLAELRASAMTRSRGDSELFLALPPHGTEYGAAGRDKYGATL